MRHRIVTKSLWFSSTWTRFSRARKCGIADGGTGHAAPPANGVFFRPSSRRLLREELRTFGSLCAGRRPRRAPARRPHLTKAAFVSRSAKCWLLANAAASSRDWASDKRAVGQGQGLLRHDALGPPVAFVDVGGVEQLQELHLLLVRRGGSRGCGAARRGPWCIGRSPARPASGRAGRQGEARCRARPRPPCGGRSSARGRRLSGSMAALAASLSRLHAVGAAGDDQPVHAASCSSRVSMNSTASQSSKRRMRGRWPFRPKSNTRRHDGAAEVPQPDVVDRHAGRQRILPVGDPAGQAPGGGRCWFADRSMACRFA